MKEKTKKLVEAFGFLKMDEAQLLMDVADSLATGSIVVNVGAGAGTSALAIIEQRPDLAVTFYTVDMRDDDNPFGGMLNELHAFQNAKLEHLLPNQIKGDSSTIGHAWDKGEIDFLIIDADHTRQGLMKDIEAWLPHLAIGGFVAFHDYASPAWQEVYGVIEETVMRDVNYEYIDVRDTMILFRKLNPLPLPDIQIDMAVETSTYAEPSELVAEVEQEQESRPEKKTSKRKKTVKTTPDEPIED